MSCLPLSLPLNYPFSTFTPLKVGTYILWLNLSTAAQLTIGKRGDYVFPAGWYAYVGSAFGSGGLRGRLKHHLKLVTKPHWHIDYLRAAAKVREIWVVASEEVYEHRWANVLCDLPDAGIPVPRFGASDCRCDTHLFHFEHPPHPQILEAETNTKIVTWLHLP